MNILNTISLKTPVDDFHMILDDDVVRVSGFGDLADIKARLEDVKMHVQFIENNSHRFTKLVAQYLSGDLAALNGIKHDQTGGDFYKKAWHAMSEIKPGQTITYKQLAAQAANPLAARAAGTACRKNRLILIIPCHRIIKSDGSTGSYLYGGSTKEWLLNHEANFAKKHF